MAQGHLTQDSQGNPDWQMESPASTGTGITYTTDADGQPEAHIIGDEGTAMRLTHDTEEDKARRIYYRSIDSRIADLDQRIEQGYQATYGRDVNARRATYYGITPSATDTRERVLSSEAKDYMAAQSLMKTTKRMQEAAQRYKDNPDALIRFAKDTGISFWNSLTDFSTWDFGMQSADEATRVRHLYDKFAAKGAAALTPSERDLLDAVTLSTAAQMAYGDQQGVGNTVGQTTAEMIPFMIEMLVSPAGSMSKEGSKILAKKIAQYAAKRFLAGTMKKGTAKAVTAIGKYGTRFLTDLGAGALMTATSSAPHVVADAEQRRTGTLYTDEYGNRLTDDEGNTGSQGDSAASAYAKAFGARTIENQSEFFGDAFLEPLTSKLGKFIIRGLEGKAGGRVLGTILTSAGKQMRRAANTSVGKAWTKFNKGAHYNGIINEYLEEVVGNFENAATVGDNNFRLTDDEGNLSFHEDNSVFNFEDNFATFLAVAVPGIVQGAAAHTQYHALKAITDRGISRSQDFGFTVFPSMQTWLDIMQKVDAIDYTDAQTASAKVRSIAQSESSTADQAYAITHYAQARAMQQSLEAGEQVKEEEETSDLIEAIRDARSQGSEIDTHADAHAASREADEAEASLTDTQYGDGIKQQIDDILAAGEQGAPALSAMLSGLTPEQRAAAEAYIQSRSKVDGIEETLLATIDQQAEDKRKEIAPYLSTEGTFATIDIDGQTRYVKGFSEDMKTVYYFDEDGKVQSAPVTEQDIMDSFSGWQEEDDYISAYRSELEQAAYDRVNSQLENHPATVTDLTAGAEYSIPVFQDGETRMQRYQVISADEQTGTVIVIPMTYKPDAVTNADGTKTAGWVIVADADPVSMSATEAILLQNEGYDAYDQRMAEQENEKGEVSDQQENAPDALPSGDSGFPSPQLQSEQQQSEQQDQHPQSALSRIPVDDQGQPIYEQTDPDTAWDAILEQTEGDADMAQSIAADMVTDKEAELKRAQTAKPRKGTTVADKIAAQKERKAAIDRAQSDLDHWKQIAATQQRRQEAEAARQAEERKAAEAAAAAESEAPEWHEDTPQAARARGYRRQGGHTYRRQDPVQAVQGKAVEVKFADDVKQQAHTAIIDASALQPSHMDGHRNISFFIDEAQPKERDGQESTAAAEKIASHINPEEITSSVTAYTGAPTVNTRGEVIQGNNRSAALKAMWQSHPEQAAAYKQHLIDHAAEFGLPPEAIEFMEQPVLVNMADVTDDRAITLGQYTASDTESGGTERIKAKATAQKMGAGMQGFASRLLRSEDEDETISQLIDLNAVETLKWMQRQGYITATQYRSAFDRKGNLTAEAANDLKGILYETIFQDGSTHLREMFAELPAKAQKALLATAYRDYDSPESERMLPELQRSIIAYHELSRYAPFAKAKSMQELQSAIIMWQMQYQIDENTGESRLPTEKYSNFALQLAAMYKGQTQRLIQSTLSRMLDLIQGKQERDLFSDNTEDNTPRTLAEAIREVLNIEYNGRNGSNVLGSDDAAGPARRQGSQTAPRRDQQGTRSQQTADNTGRTGVPDDERGAESGSRELDNNGRIAERREKILANMGDKYALSTEQANNGELFIQNENGSTTLAIIPDGIFDRIGIKPVPFKLTETMGWHVYDHHRKEANLNSVSDAIDFVLSIINNVDHVRLGRDNTYIFSVEENRNRLGRRAITIMVNSKTGEFIGIRSSGYETLKKLKERPLLWERGAHAVPEDVATPTITTIKPQHGDKATSRAKSQSNGLSADEKSVSASSSDIETEPQGKRNGTAAPQNGLSSASKGTTLHSENQAFRTENRTEAEENRTDTPSASEQEQQTQRPVSQYAPEELNDFIDGILREHPFIGDDLREDDLALDIIDWADTHPEATADEVKAAAQQIIDEWNEEEKEWLDRHAKEEEARHQKEEEDSNFLRSLQQVLAPFKDTGSTEAASAALSQFLASLSPERLMNVAERCASSMPRTSKKESAADWHATALEHTVKHLKQLGITVKKGRSGLKEGDRTVTSDGVSAGHVQSIDPESKTATVLFKDGSTETLPLSKVKGYIRRDTSTQDPLGRARSMETERKAKQEQASTSSSPHGNVTGYSITPAQYTTKRGKVLDMHLVTFDTPLSKEQQRAAAAMAKDMKGWHDKTRGGFLMRSEEDARKLAAAAAENGEQLADAAPLSVADLQEADPKQDTAPQPPKPANRQDETPSAGKPADKPKNSGQFGLVSDERMEELKARLRKKLGSQLNMGIDPEILAIGIELAAGHIDRGIRTFTDYAKVMVEDLGDVIRPYLKAFYNGARDMPEITEHGLDKDMTPYEDVRAFDTANFDKPQPDPISKASMMVKEGKAQAQADKANQTLKEKRNERRKEADEQRAADTAAVAEEAETIASEAEAHAENTSDERSASAAAERVDEALGKVSDQLALLGYYEADQAEKDYNEAYGYMRNAEKKAVKDAADLASRLIDDLGLDRDEATHGTADKKGRRKKKPLATANIAPTGGDITITLPLDEGRELHVCISLSPTAEKGVTSINGDNLQADSIAYRVNNPNSNGNDRYGNNVWVNANVPYGELLKGIQRIAYKYLPERIETKDSEYHAGEKVEYSPDGGRTWSDAVVFDPDDNGYVLLDTGLAPVMYVSATHEQLRHKAAEEKTDSQGNPLNADGSLKVDKVGSVNELTDEDFSKPARNVELPMLPKNVAEAIGTNGKPVVIKKNIFERNAERHPDISARQSRDILTAALYTPDLYGQNQKTKRPYNWIVINTKDSEGKNRLVLLEVNPNKDNIEIVHWHYARNNSLEQIKRQAESEGGLILILPSEKSEEAGGLSSRTPDLSSADKGTKSAANLQEDKSGKHPKADAVKRTIDDIAKLISDHKTFRNAMRDNMTRGAESFASTFLDEYYGKNFDKLLSESEPFAREYDKDPAKMAERVFKAAQSLVGKPSAEDFIDSLIDTDAVAALPEDDAIHLQVVDILNPGMTNHSMKSKIDNFTYLLPKISDGKLAELDKRFGDDKIMGRHIKAEVNRRKESQIDATDLPEPAKEKAKRALHGSDSMTDNAALAEAERRIEKKKTTNKVKPEQHVGELFAGKSDENTETELKSDENKEIHRTFAIAVKNDMLASLDNGTKPYRSILDLRKRAKALGMDVDDDGRTDILLQELVEDGLVRAAREVTARVGNESKEAYDLICKLYEMQPTISARSSNRIKMQQYSTPLPMAWCADHFAMHGKEGGLVLEPTAGNGMLVFGVPAGQVHANELDETRLANLREQGFAEVTQQDATEPFDGGQKYDAIISNPPFGKREAAEYDGKMIGGLDPQITLNALASMKDDGRAAIIIGGNMEYAANGGIKNMKPFFTYLYDHYNVKGVVDMDGKLYAKQGTTFPTRMILIDGRRSEEERAQSAVYPPVKSKAVRKAESFEDL